MNPAIIDTLASLTGQRSIWPTHDKPDSVFIRLKEQGHADEKVSALNEALKGTGITATNLHMLGETQIELNGVTAANVKKLGAKKHIGETLQHAFFANSDAEALREMAQTERKTQFSLPVFADPKAARAYEGATATTPFRDGDYTFANAYAGVMPGQMEDFGDRLTKVYTDAQRDGKPAVTAQLDQFATMADQNHDKEASNKELAALALAATMVTGQLDGHTASSGGSGALNAVETLNSAKVSGLLSDPKEQAKAIAIAGQILQDNNLQASAAPVSDADFLARTPNLDKPYSASRTIK